MGQYYKHFKGNIYKVMHIAKHSETLEDMVVYQAMYGEKGIWVRPKTMFEEVIARDGKTFRRFEPISDEDGRNEEDKTTCQLENMSIEDNLWMLVKEQRKDIQTLLGIIKKKDREITSLKAELNAIKDTPGL